LPPANWRIEVDSLWRRARQHCLPGRSGKNLLPSPVSYVVSRIECAVNDLPQVQKDAVRLESTEGWPPPEGSLTD
jgi:hypothetical protein